MPRDNRKISRDELRFALERYQVINTRYQCPGCNKDKTFVRYIDTETGVHVHPSVGRCNRESNCGYHYTPKQYYQDNHISTEKNHSRGYNKLAITIAKPKTISYIPAELLKASLKNYDNNNFVRFLIELFGVENPSHLINRYFIATSRHRNGATVFWYIDLVGKINYGKIMVYNIVASTESYTGRSGIR
ncbi:MAG: PG0870-related protein [Bacteroidia bacterium]|nr:PG0870-related protein [Bacteroidia bacterium]